MDLTTLFGDFISLYRDRGWIGQAAAIVTVVVLINLAIRVVLRRAQRVAARSATIWDNAVLDALGRPLRWLVWVLGIGMAAELVPAEDAPQLAEWVPVLRKVLVVGLLTWFLLRLVRQVEQGLDALQPAVVEEIIATANAAEPKLRALVEGVVQQIGK